MGITRWDPFNELNHMRHQIDRYMDTLWGRTAGHQLAQTAQFGPRMDVYQNNNEVVATAELPGIESREDIEVRVEDDSLTLKGEIRKSQERKDEDFIHSERYYGTFTRVIRLPAKVRADQARASYQNGILEIRIPKADPGDTRGHRIPIQ